MGNAALSQDTNALKELADNVKASPCNMRYFANQVAQITDHVYLSSVGGVTQERSLEESGITHILNVSKELQDLKYPSADLNVVRVSLRDSVEEDILPHLDYLVDHVDSVVRAGGHIAVHCIAGVSRSATVCIAYLVKYHDLTLRDAYKHVLEAREVIHPNRSFWRSLVEFEEACHGTTSVELRPYICGMEPDVYRRSIETRIKIGWMEHLMLFWTLNLGLLMAQVFFG